MSCRFSKEEKLVKIRQPSHSRVPWGGLGWKGDRQTETETVTGRQTDIAIDRQIAVDRDRETRTIRETESHTETQIV